MKHDIRVTQPTMSRHGMKLQVLTLVRDNHQLDLIMVALCNRADHYIFILFLSSSFFFFLFFPRLISAVGDWMFTILWRMVWS